MGIFSELDLIDKGSAPDPFDGALILSAYTRAHAIADGVLFDVSTTAREAGIIWPVALTHALMRDVEDIPVALRGLCDVEGRLWDVLFMAAVALRRGGSGDQLTYQLFLPVSAPTDLRTLYTVKLVCGPGDAGEPTITLMRPDES